MPPKKTSKRRRPNQDVEKGKLPNASDGQGRDQLLLHARTASKSRRDQEGEEFAQLADLLPVTTEVKSRLDKGAILRLTVAYLQTRNLASSSNKGPEPQALKTSSGGELDVELSELLQEGLDGFLMVVTYTGRILYVSNHVPPILGYQPYEMTGADLQDFTTRQDYKLFSNQFHKIVPRVTHPPLLCTNMKAADLEPESDQEHNTPSNPGDWLTAAMDVKRLFGIRMRFKVVNKSNKTKQTGFISIQWTAKLRLVDMGISKEKSNPTVCLMSVCRPIASPSLKEPNFFDRTFIVRIGLDKMCTYCDERITHFMGYEPSEMIGASIGEFYHPEDLQIKMTCSEGAWGSGHAISYALRMINKMGRYVWIEVHSVLVYGPKQEILFGVGIHHVLSEKQGQEMARKRIPGTLFVGNKPPDSGRVSVGNAESAPPKESLSKLPNVYYTEDELTQLLSKREARMASMGLTDTARDLILQGQPKSPGSSGEPLQYNLVSVPDGSSNDETSVIPAFASSDDVMLRHIFQRYAASSLNRPSSSEETLPTVSEQSSSPQIWAPGDSSSSPSPCADKSNSSEVCSQEMRQFNNTVSTYQNSTNDQYGQVSPETTGGGHASPPMSSHKSSSQAQTSVANILQNLEGQGHSLSESNGHCSSEMGQGGISLPTMTGAEHSSPLMAGIGYSSPSVVDVGYSSASMAGDELSPPAISGDEHSPPTMAGDEYSSSINESIGYSSPTMGGIGYSSTAMTDDECSPCLPEDLSNISLTHHLFGQEENVNMDNLLDDILDIQLLKEKNKDSDYCRVEMDKITSLSSGSHPDDLLSNSGSYISQSDDVTSSEDTSDIDLFSDMTSLDNVIENFLYNPQTRITNEEQHGTNGDSESCVESIGASAQLKRSISRDSSNKGNFWIGSPSSPFSLDLVEFEDLF